MIQHGGNFMIFMDDTIRQMNAEIVKENKECQGIIEELKKLEHFISNLGFLSMGRDFIFCKGWSFSRQNIMISLELTLGNICACCEHASMADGNALLRKYRDDLVFYLYLSAYDANKKLECIPDKIAKMENIIADWAENKLEGLQIGTVLLAISSMPQLKEAVKKYSLKSSFDRIGKRLNNYVHSNGYSYYNQNANIYKSGELEASLHDLLSDAKYITITFMFLLILCDPLMVMSTDYIDCLDSNMEPHEGSQYWVATFVEEFIKSNISGIEANCLSYLKENTSMQF